MTRLGNFWKFLAASFLANIAQMFGDFLGNLENHNILSQTAGWLNCWATVENMWTTFYYNIWSHWHLLPIFPAIMWILESSLPIYTYLLYHLFGPSIHFHFVFPLQLPPLPPQVSNLVFMHSVVELAGTNFFVCWRRRRRRRRSRNDTKQKERKKEQNFWNRIFKRNIQI